MNDPKLTRHLGRWTLVLALAGIAAPAAQARHAPADRVPTTSHSAQVDASTQHHHPDVAQPSTRIIAVTRADRFDWGDAGIGAAGAIGAALLVGGSALLLRRNKDERAMTARFES